MAGPRVTSMSRSTNKQHDIFVRDGDDLHCTISVPMVDAALGTTVTVDAILDGPTEITIPAGTQPGSVTTLRGHGMPHLRSGVRGNLHAHIDVVVPGRLDHQDIELLHKLKEKRVRDVAEVSSTQSASAGGGLFSRLRETVHRPLTFHVSERFSMSTRCPGSGSSSSSTATRVFTRPTCGVSAPARNSISATAPEPSRTVSSRTSARAD